LLVYAIEGENFSIGIGLTPKVEQAGQKVVEQVCEEVQNALKQMRTNSYC
jgi:Ni,Fe-hydrogenase maturation factor